MNIKFKNKWYDITMDELEELADQIDQIYGVPICGELMEEEIEGVTHDGEIVKLNFNDEGIIRIEKIKTKGERSDRCGKCAIR